MIRWILLGSLASGCGEVETVKLAVAPDPDDFRVEIQPLVEQLGCSANGRCHTVAAGNLQFIEDPSPSQLDENYLSVVGKLDLETPADSDFLKLLLQGTEGRTHPRPTYCFESTDSCAYRKILTWAAWKGPGDPRPQDVACEDPDERCP